MEKNCQKGYFLVETIISLTVVATIITIVYGAVTSSFIKQNDKLTKINTTEGIYATKEIDKYFKYDLEKLEKSITNENPYVDLDVYVNDNYSTNYEKFRPFYKALNIEKLYFSIFSLRTAHSTSSDACNGTWHGSPFLLSILANLRLSGKP